MSLKTTTLFLATILLASLFIPLMSVIAESPVSFVVSPDGSQDYDTIQDAIDAASAGDTIFVWEGIYNEDLIVSKQLTLMGNGSSNTTIIGSGTGSTVKITAGGVVISGFNVTGGGYLNDDDPGAAFLIDNSNDCVLSYNLITANDVGIYLYQSSGTEVSNNTVTASNSYAVDIYKSHSNILRHNNISGNDDHSVLIDESNTNKIQYNNLNGNKYGVSVASGDNNIIEGNEICGSDHNGIRIFRGSGNHILNNNVSSINGDGISINTRNALVENNTINMCDGNGIQSHGGETNTYQFNTVNHSSKAGISIEGGFGHVLFGNVINASGEQGITTKWSESLTIKANTIANSSEEGMRLEQQDDAQLDNNTVKHSGGHGILFHNSDNIVLDNNTVNASAMDGIHLRWDCEGALVKDNQLNDNTIGVSYWIDTGTLLVNNIFLGNLQDVDEKVPGEIIVDINGEGDYTSLAEAIEAAAPGETIFVWEGIYTESLQLNKGLKIIGNSSTNTSVDISSTGDYAPLHICCSVDVLIANLSFTGSLENGYGIGISSSDNVTIIGCNVTGNGFGIYAWGSSNVTISDSVIFDNTRAGIVIEGVMETVLLVDNHIISNAQEGIRLSGSEFSPISDILVMDNIINNNREGIKLIADGVMIDGNDISNNDIGILMDKASNNTLNGNDISDNPHGIQLIDSNNNTIKNNSIIQSVTAGLDLKDSHSNSIIDNHVHSNKEGVYLETSSSNIIDGNNISDNAANGTMLIWNSNDTIYANNTVKGNDIGLFIAWNSFATILTDNDISDNTVDDVKQQDPPTNIVDAAGGGDFLTIQAAIDSVFPGEVIHVWSGVYDETVVIDKKLTIIGNGTSQTIIDGGGIPEHVLTITADNVVLKDLQVRNSTSFPFDSSSILLDGVSGCRLEGVAATGSLIGLKILYSDNNEIVNSNISDNINGGIGMSGADGNLFYGNLITDTDGRGIDLINSDQNTFTANIIKGNSLKGFYIDSSWYNIISDNTITDNGEQGIYLIYRAQGNTISNNTVTGNGIAGINLEGSDLGSNAYPFDNDISNNTITDNLGHGVMFENAGEASVLESNTINGNTLSGVLVKDTSEITLRCNDINDNGESGIRMHNSSNVAVLGNTLLGNDVVGIYLSSSNDNELAGNVLSDNGIGFTMISSEGNLLHNNTATGNDGSGFVIESSEDNTVEDNNISANGANGVHLLHGSVGNTIRNNTIGGNNLDGIRVQGADGNLLIGNNISGNNRDGVYLFRNTEANTVTGNNITANRVGIYLWDTDEVVPTGGPSPNVVDDNTVEGNNLHDILYDLPRDLTVHASGEGDHIKINDALDDIADGFKIFVWEGSYSESVVLDRDVLLIGNSSSSVTLSGDGISPVIYVNFSDIRVIGLTLTNGIVGISVENAEGCHLEDIRAVGNIGDGIHIMNSNGTTITACNSSSNGERGLSIADSSDCTVSNSLFIANTWDGIRLSGGSNNTVYGNEVKDNLDHGIYLGSEEGSFVTSNIVADNNENGIYLYYGNNNSVSGNMIKGNHHGMELYQSDDNVLSTNTVNDSAGHAIYVWGCWRTEVVDNILADGDDNGIRLRDRGNHLVEGNIITNFKGHGIELDGSVDNVLRMNWIQDNDLHGIFLVGADDNGIEDNRISANGGAGIKLDSCERNNISGNGLSLNYVGLNSSASSNNTLFGNYLIANTLQAYDDGSNTWNLSAPVGGNYWSDYDGSIVEGFGGIPRHIPGGENNDSLPLVLGDYLVADSGGDVTITHGTNLQFDAQSSTPWAALHNATWTISGDTVIYGLVTNYTFNNVGVYEVVLNVSDAAGVWSKDILTVTVGGTWAPTITSEAPRNLAGETFVVNHSISHTLTANETVTWTFASNTGFLQFSPGNSTIWGKPSLSDHGTYWINVTATSVDGKMQTYANYTIEVIEKVYVQGVIKDSKGNPISGVEIFIEGQLVAVTDDDGIYAFLIEEGEHQLQPVKEGFVFQSLSLQAQTGVVSEIESTVGVQVEDDGLPVMMLAAIAVVSLLIVGVYLLRRKS